MGVEINECEVEGENRKGLIEWERRFIDGKGKEGSSRLSNQKFADEYNSLNRMDEIVY